MTETEFKQIDEKLTDVRIQVRLGADKEIIDQMLYDIQCRLCFIMD